MPSKRKRIGYLPSPIIQEIIKKISIKEKLSQSKIVGKLVEEALIARGVVDLQNKNDLIIKTSYRNQNNNNEAFIKYSDLDELISDKGITYNNKYKGYSEDVISDPLEPNNEELFKQFKKFIMFQKMIKKK